MMQTHAWWVLGQLAVGGAVTWFGEAWVLPLYVALNLGGLWDGGRQGDSWRSKRTVLRALGIVLLPTGLVLLLTGDDETATSTGQALEQAEEIRKAAAFSPLQGPNSAP